MLTALIGKQLHLIVYQQIWVKLATDVIYSYNVLTCFSFLHSLLDDDAPCIEFSIIDFARDFELPGFPITNRGIFSSIHTSIIKTFSLRATLRAMFLGMFSSICDSIILWKLIEKYDINFFTNNCNTILNRLKH